MSKARAVVNIPSGRRTKWAVLVFWLVVVAAMGPLAGKLMGAEKNDASAWLPANAESTKVLNLQSHIQSPNVFDAVVVYERPTGLTAADRAKATADARRFAHIDGAVSRQVAGPFVARDGQAIETIVPVNLGKNGWNAAGTAADKLRAIARSGADNLSVHIAGPLGNAADSSKAFKGIDSTLLFATLAVVIILLLITYRSPILWLLPVISAGIALTSAQALIYLLATHAGLTVNAQSAGILYVLVFGAGTDYALLLTARYREELRRHEDRHEAMAVALRRAGPAIIASAATVVISLLVLTVAELNSTKGMGPVLAIGVLVGMLAMITLLPALLVIQMTRGHPDSVIGEQVAARHFPAGAGQPVIIVGNQADAAQLASAVRSTPGIVGVTPPKTVAGHAYLEGTLTARPDSQAAYNTIDRVRAAVHPIRGADAMVGGTTAINLDVRRASAHDRNLIIPLVLVVVFLILGLLLRALVAPIMLIATVVLSFAAALGVSALMFSNVFNFAGADTSFPLFVFVFLVALGIDYNIFLMTRVHEEAKRHGPRTGALIGLAATGGVITSAGLVLAGTFAVLGTLPVTFLTELGFAVAFGVLLDAIIVRSVLVTALNLDLGRWVWWPSKLARAPHQEEAEPLTEPRAAVPQR